MTATRKKEHIGMANRYSDTAIKVSTRSAVKDFFDDYFAKKMNAAEHIVLLCLVRKYIECKSGVITREACSKEQAVLFQNL